MNCVTLMAQRQTVKAVSASDTKRDDGVASSLFCIKFQSDNKDVQFLSSFL